MFVRSTCGPDQRIRATQLLIDDNADLWYHAAEATAWNQSFRALARLQHFV